MAVCGAGSESVVGGTGALLACGVREVLRSDRVHVRLRSSLLMRFTGRERR